MTVPWVIKCNDNGTNTIPSSLYVQLQYTFLYNNASEALTITSNYIPCLGLIVAADVDNVA